MGIPSVTTNLSGFGCFMQEHVADPAAYGKIFNSMSKYHPWVGKAKSTAMMLWLLNFVLSLLQWGSLGEYIQCVFCYIEQASQASIFIQTFFQFFLCCLPLTSCFILPHSALLVLLWSLPALPFNASGYTVTLRALQKQRWTFASLWRVQEQCTGTSCPVKLVSTKQRVNCLVLYKISLWK